jgi:hypothetical protein
VAGCENAILCHHDYTEWFPSCAISRNYLDRELFLDCIVRTFQADWCCVLSMLSHILVGKLKIWNSVQYEDRIFLLYEIR